MRIGLDEEAIVNGHLHPVAILEEAEDIAPELRVHATEPLLQQRGVVGCDARERRDEPTIPNGPLLHPFVSQALFALRPQPRHVARGEEFWWPEPFV